MNLETLPASGNSVTPGNNNFALLDWSTAYGRNPATSSGLNWGYHGTPTTGIFVGYWGGLTNAGGTIALTNNATNYLVVDRSTGVLSASIVNTNWLNTTNYARAYIVTTVTGAVTAVQDHRAGLYGIISGAGAAGANGVAMAVSFTSDTSNQADTDPGAGVFKWNNAVQGSATVLYFDNLTQDAVSLTTLWASLATTGFIYIIQANDTTRWQIWKWTASPVDGTGYRKFTAALQAKGVDIANSAICYTQFFGMGSAGATAGKQAIYIPANRISPSATGGCAALATIATTANQPDIQSLNFDTTTQEFAQFSVAMPKKWNRGTVTAKFLWSHAATTVNFGVAWQLQGLAVSDDDQIPQAYGTAIVVTDTGGTTNDLYVTAETAAITIAGTPASEDAVFFRVGRVPADAGDNMAIDARLHGVVLFITTEADTDA